MDFSRIENYLACPKCKEELKLGDDKLVCSDCGNSYNIKDEIPLLKIETSLDNKFEMDYVKHYEQDAELFDYFEERECAATAHDENRLRQYILSLVPKEAETILDVGSGSAWVAKRFAKENKTIVSFDISRKNVSKALEAYKSENHLGVVGDAMQAPFKDNSFDCVIASEIIEHTPKPDKFLAEAFRIVKPGGSLIISCPYKEKIRYNLCVHCNRLTPQNAHLHSFDENKLLDLCDKHNLKNAKYYIFGNKALTTLRTHVFLKYLPLPLWKAIDKAANIIINKPAHIIVKYNKVKTDER